MVEESPFARQKPPEPMKAPRLGGTHLALIGLLIAGCAHSGGPTPSPSAALSPQGPSDPDPTTEVSTAPRADEPPTASQVTSSCDGSAIDTEREVGDYNFDGHDDVSVLGETFAKSYLRHYWLWSPARRCFLHHKPLSELLNARVDEPEKVVSAYTNDGAAGLMHTHQKYRFEGDAFVLFYEVVQAAGPQSGKLTRTVKERIDGELKTTSTEVMTMEEAERAATRSK